MSQKNIAIIIGCIFLLSAFSSNLAWAIAPITDSNLSADDISDWTIMYYMAANNKYSKKTYQLLQNLTFVGSTDKVNIVVFRDGYQNGDTGVYFVTKGKLINISEELGWPSEVDSSSPLTLRKFCNDTMRDYIAHHYALLIISPGFGWQGICPDFQNFSYFNFNYYLIDMPELRWVLHNVTQNGKTKIDILSLNMCITGMIEVAHEISSYVNFMIASEADNAPMFMWPDDSIVQQLVDSPEMSAEVLTQRIIDGHIPYYYRMNSPVARIFNRLPFPLLHTVTIKTSLSGINLTKVKQVVENIDNLSSLLTLNLEYHRSVIRESRFSVRTFGGWSPKYHLITRFYDKWLALNIFAFDEYIDLYDFARLINISTDNASLKTHTISLMQNIDKAVIKIKKLQGDHSYGISIYFPSSKRSYNRPLWGYKIISPYEKTSFAENTLWDECLKKYLNV